MNLKFNKLQLAILIGALSGCMGPSLHTPSGKPEVSIDRATPSATRTAIINAMLNSGFTVQQDANYTISFDKPLGSSIVSALTLQHQKDARVTFSIVQNGQAVRIVADMAMISNPGSAFEQRFVLDDRGDSNWAQGILEQVKRALK